MKFFRRFRKNISLRIVNFAGLSIMFACLLQSAGYIKRELSYDRHHTYANRITRLSLQFDDQLVDGRVWGNAIYTVLQQIPEIDRTAKISQVQTGVLTYQGKHRIINDFFLVNRDFLHVFDIPLLQGVKEDALQRKNQVLISERLARQLFGDFGYDEFQLPEFYIESNRFSGSVFVSGIFKDIPETSHFYTDILLYLGDDDELFTYVYLLLKNQTDTKSLAKKITNLITDNELFQPSQTRARLMPLTDIHLHSRNLREMSVNGSIHYIYLIVGANLLLLIVVLFNLWLNASLIFAANRRYYQILRLHGGPASVVFKDEALSALFLGIISIIVSVPAACYVLSFGYIPGQISFVETFVLCILFLGLIVAVSLLPAVTTISSTLFLNTNHDWKPVRFSYSNVKWMLTVQYAVVMIVVILAFGINKQMNLVKDTQVGGNERNILVMSNQPFHVKAKYSLLKTELLKHTEIESVTASFQLPGDAIRDVIGVRKEDDMEWRTIPLMVSGEDFLSFFQVDMIAGRSFSPGRYDYQTEEAMFSEYVSQRNYSENTEEYVINRKALAVLGYNTPEEAIGEMLQIGHGSLDYIRRGVIVGVTDDFNYTGLYEETIPLLILQRNVYLHCIMVRLAPGRVLQARAVFEKVWNEVIPEFPANQNPVEAIKCE